MVQMLQIFFCKTYSSFANNVELPLRGRNLTNLFKLYKIILKSVPSASSVREVFLAYYLAYTNLLIWSASSRQKSYKSIQILQK